MTDSTDGRGRSIHRHRSTGTERDARSVAAVVMPTVQDVLASGVDDQFLKDVLQGRASSHFGQTEFRHLLGLKRNLAWDYEHVHSSGGGGAGASRATTAARASAASAARAARRRALGAPPAAARRASSCGRPSTTSTG